MSDVCQCGDEAEYYHEGRRWCSDCYSELRTGKIPKVTDPSVPPSGTGTVYRQQMKRGKTDG